MMLDDKRSAPGHDQCGLDSFKGTPQLMALPFCAFAEIGVGLTALGFLFTVLGVIFFFDKSLLAMGNVSGTPWTPLLRPELGLLPACLSCPCLRALYLHIISFAPLPAATISVRRCPYNWFSSHGEVLYTEKELQGMSRSLT